jgi:hypothetical protein
MKKFLSLLVIAILAIGFTGCGEDNENEDSVSFENYSSPSVIVNNNTSERLIAFKESLHSDNLISGIPANASNHGLKRDPLLFNTTGDFTLILITEAEYNNNINNLVSADIFTMLYVFYRHETNVAFRVSVSSKIGGSGRLIIENPTDWGVEIRINSPDGEIEILSFVPPYTENMVLKVVPDDYVLYPVFKRFNSLIGEIITVTPTFPYDSAVGGTPFFGALRIGNTALHWNLGNLLNTHEITLGGIIIQVNNSARVAVGLNYNGSPMVFSGHRLINPDQIVSFFIPFTKSSDGTFPQTQTISTFEIDIGGGSYKEVPVMDYELDYFYTITVSGTNISALTVGTPVKGGKLDFANMLSH